MSITVDPLAHCRRASRPSVLWMELCLLSNRYQLDEHVMCKIHNIIMNSLPAERDGMFAFNERLERQESARKSANAEKFLPLYKILGFETLNGYLAHKQMERQAEQQRCIMKMDDWKLFGYPNREAFLRAQRRAVKRERGQ